MATALELPEGFELDESQVTGLPSGFELDKPDVVESTPEPETIDQMQGRLRTQRTSDIGLEEARRQIDVGGIQTGEAPEIPFGEAISRDIRSFGTGLQENIQTSLKKQGRITKLMTKNNPSEADLEEMSNFALGFVTGGLKLNSSTAINKLIGKEITPEIAERMRLAEQSGVKLSIADITGKKHHALLESYFQQNIPSADVAQGFAENKVRSVDWLRETIKRSYGGREGMLEAGQKAQAGAWKNLNKFYEIAKQKYKSIPVKSDTLIETNNLRDVAIGYMDDVGELQSSAIKRILNVAKGKVDQQIKFDPKSIVSATGQPFKGAKLPEYTWKQLLDDKSTLLKQMRSTSDFNKRRIFKDLVNAIDDDIAKFSETVADPSVKVALDDAVNFYKSGGDGLPGITTFRDRKIANMLATNSPEKIVDNFIKPNNVSDINRLMNTVDAEGRKSLKKAWFEKLTTKGEEQSFSLQKFVTGFNKYDKNTLKSFLSKEEIDGLRLLSRVSKVSQTAEKLAGNMSGTGQSISTFVLARSLFSNPVMAAVYWMGSKRAANVYFNNPTARKLMIEGLKLPPKSAKAIDNTFKVLAIEGLMEQSNQEDGQLEQGEQ